MDFISPEPEKIVNDIQKIANLLIQSEENYAVDARDLLTSIILYLFANTEKTKSFGEIARMVTGNLVKELSDGVDMFKSAVHLNTATRISRFLKKDSQAQNATIGVLNKYLEPWLNPFIDYATSESDFDIADFKTQKTTLYVGLVPADINRLQPIMQFFYQHVAERLMVTAQSLGYNEENGGICLFMDDFCSVGKLELFRMCIPYFRGYKIKLFLISSDIEQIEGTYGEAGAQGIISTCSSKIVFAANDYKTANKISKMCIDKTTNAELLSWQQIINLPQDSQIILREHEQPIISKKIKYYDDAAMKKKITDPDAIS